jgi:hypothetical protein
MVFQVSEVERQLVGKFAFSRDTGREAGHRWYSLHLAGLQPVRTKVSHGARNLPKALESRMAKQLRVRRAFFVDMISCTKSRDEYYEAIRQNPIPPWDVQVL